MPIPEPAPVPEPKPEAEPLITQDTERSIAAQRAAEEAARKKAAEEAAQRAAEEAARKKAAEEAARRAAEEAARKKAAEEAAKRAAANNRVAGAFGSAGNKGSSGNSTGNGNQGSPDGNSNAGQVNGVGGLGTGPSAKVNNRTAVYLAKPQYADPNSEGTVLVSIQVSATGAVIKASVTSSTTSSAALKNAAVAAAKQSKFSEGESIENGTITYRFKLQ
jgi:TolA protein